jgi:hypothetical protein
MWKRENVLRWIAVFRDHRLMAALGMVVGLLYAAFSVLIESSRSRRGSVFDEPQTVIDYGQVHFAFLGIPFLIFIIGSNDLPREERRQQGGTERSGVGAPQTLAFVG